MPSPKELAAGLKAQEATSPNSKVMFVGQEHGKKTVLPDNVKKMAEKYGAYYEGAGGDKSDAVKYQGSWDDKASKEVKGYPKEFLYTLFTNSNVNNQKKNLTQPDKTIFDSALAAQDKWGYFKDRKFDADTLKQFLSASGMLDKSKQPATESNVKKFIDEGEGLMWPKNWEEYPNPAGKLAQKASEYRTNWLKSQKEGVYFVGSDHMKELNKPKEPAPSQLAKALAYRGEIRNTPQNSFLGGVANFLAPVSEFLDRGKLPESIPLLGGMSAADVTGVKGTESLVRDMSYGTPPIRGASLQTAKVDPRVLDLAGVSGAMIPVGKALGKAALREGARQIETGTGIGRAALDPRMSIRSSKDQNIAEGLYHPIGGGTKLVKPISEMTSTRVANTPMVARREISPEDLYGGYIVPAVGDRTAAGSLLTHIGDTKLANPVQLEGGADFMRTHAPYGSAWAADKGAASGLASQIRDAAQGGRDVYMPHVSMGHTSGDFSTMMANSLLEQIANSKITKKAVNEFDRNVKAIRPEFKGLAHPETRDMLNDNGALRHAFVAEMGLKQHSNAGFPDLATTRAAISEPGLMDAPLHSSGFTIAKMNPAGSIITDPASPAHTSYNTQLAGNYVGGFAAQPPRSVMYPSFYNERRAAGKPESSDPRSFQLGHPGQVANQEWLDSVMGWMEKNPKVK